MIRCQYWDAGWCYAPDYITNNSSCGQCLQPDSCPYLAKVNGQGKLLGKELMEKFAKMNDEGRLQSEIVRECGYFEISPQGTERLDFTSFWDGLLKAKGVDPIKVKEGFNKCFGDTFIHGYIRAKFLENLLMSSSEPFQYNYESLEKIEDAWNAEADAYNGWDCLGLDEIVQFVQERVIARLGLPSGEGTTPEVTQGKDLRGLGKEQGAKKALTMYAEDISEAHLIVQRLTEEGAEVISVCSVPGNKVLKFAIFSKFDPSIVNEANLLFKESN